MSKETKWTQGPWLNVGGWVDSEDDSHGSIICSLSAVDRKPDYISDANANLIAAAPLMYLSLANRSILCDSDIDNVLEAIRYGDNEKMRELWDRIQGETCKI